LFLGNTQPRHHKPRYRQYERRVGSEFGRVNTILRGKLLDVQRRASRGEKEAEEYRGGLSDAGYVYV
jgi:hypothetical protein